MGRDKLTLPFGDATLLSWIVQRLSACFDQVIIVGDHEVPGYELIRDAGQGPLTGLAAALAASLHPRVFVCGGDMPFVDREVIRRMAELEGEAIVPRLERPQPLHAFYSIQCRSSVDELLGRGVRRLMDLLDCVPVRWMEDSPALQQSCRSVNTPEDYATALAWLSRPEAGRFPGLASETQSQEEPRSVPPL